MEDVLDLIVGATEPEPGIMSSSEINVHVPEPSVQEGDEDVLDLIVGDNEPEPGIMSSSEINVHVPETSVQEGGIPANVLTDNNGEKDNNREAPEILAGDGPDILAQFDGISQALRNADHNNS